MDPCDDDSSSTNDEIQRLWDKIEAMQSTGVLENENAAWQRQDSMPMPCPDTTTSPTSNSYHRSVATGGNNYNDSDSVTTSHNSNSSPVSTTTTTTTESKKTKGSLTPFANNQDSTQSQHQSTGDCNPPFDSCSDDSSSSSSSSSSGSSSEDVSDTSSVDASSSSDSLASSPSLALPAKVCVPSKNPYLQNSGNKTLLASKKEQAALRNSNANPLRESQRDYPSKTIKNPYRSIPKAVSVIQKNRTVDLTSSTLDTDLSSQVQEKSFNAQRDHDSGSLFLADLSSVEVLDDDDAGEISRFFHPDKKSQSQDQDKANAQQATRKKPLTAIEIRDTVILEDSDDDSSIQEFSKVIAAGEKGQNMSLNANPSSPPDVVNQHYQTEVEHQPDIDPSLYSPPVYKERPRPVLHRFTTQNRPIHARPEIPTSNLFPAPMNLLWQSKFERFNHLQSEVANIICDSDDNFVVSAPTGAGKTAIFEMGLARFMSRDLQFHGTSIGSARLSRHRKVVYFAPSKALCEERHQDWSNRLSRLHLGIEVSMITGDVEPGHSYSDLANSHLILTTPEKWDSILRKWSENFYLLASVKLLMLDEVHLLGDPSRGCCLESIIARMKTIQRASQNAKVTQLDLDSSNYPNTSPEAIAACMRIIAVSATLPNIEDVAEFLGANEAFTFDDSYRPVPLNTQVVGLGYIGKNEYRFWMNLDEQIPHLIARYSSGKPTLVFCHTKKETEKLVQRLINNNFCHKNAASAPAGTVQYCLDKGVAYHHAGMDASERRRVEQAFADRKLRCLCATSTLAVGVNLPAHLVIIKGTKTWRGGGSGYQEIDSRSLLQMIGRAGRPGFDTSGTAIIMTDNASKSKFEQMTRGLGTADSQLLHKLVDVINTEISHRVIVNLDGALRWLKTTFLFPCLKANPLRFGCDPRKQSIDEFLLNHCKEAIDLLSEAGLVGGHDILFPREPCHIMSQSMVPFGAMKLIVSLSFDATQCQILKAISNMEMIHFPVRRLEKKALNACHKSEATRFKLEGPLSKVRIQKPNEKTFVLLQAYISKEDLESFTLRQEMSTLADKAQHILSTAQDYSIKGSRHGQVALQCLKLRRSLQLCLWGVSSGVLNQIQDVGHKSTAQLKLNGIVSFEQVIESTEAEVEKAAGRPHPFGKRLRTVVTKILREKINMKAELEYTRGSNIPAGVQCLLRSPKQAPPTVGGTEKAQVNYTLLAYTDKPGTTLFFQEGITSTGSYRFCCPRNFGKVFIHLIASVVGLDETCVLDGNGQPHAPTFGASSKALPRNSPLCQNTQPKRSATIVRNVRNPNPKLNDGSMRKSQVLHPNNVSSLTQQLFSGSHKTEDKIAKSSTTLTGFAEERVKSRATITPQIQRMLQRDSRAQGHDETSPKSVSRLTRYVDQAAMSATNREAYDQRTISVCMASFEPQNSRRFVSPVVHHFDPPSNSVTLSKKRGLLGSWNQTKRKQQRSQQRAFATKKDNPFVFFRHDPNDAESFLEGLSTEHSARTSIIPQAKLQELHHNNQCDGRTPYRCQPRRQAFNHKADNRKRRNFGAGPRVSAQQLLRMKAAESDAGVQEHQWGRNDMGVACPQRMGTMNIHHLRVPHHHNEYPSQTEYPLEDSFSSTSGAYEVLSQKDPYDPNLSWQFHPEPPHSEMTQLQPQQLQQGDSLVGHFGSALSHHTPFEPDHSFEPMDQHQAHSFHHSMESPYGLSLPPRAPLMLPHAEQEHWPVCDEKQSQFRDVFF